MAVSRKRKIIIAVALVAVVGMIVVVSIFASGKDESEVTVVKIETRPELRSVVTASGEVRPIQFINLTSEVAGRIEELYVNPGDQVTKGQPLVRLDPTQLQSSQEAQAAAVQASFSDVQNARSSVTAAENSVAQSQQALIVAEAAVSQARQGVVTSQTSVDSAQVGLERAQTDLAAAQRDRKRSAELVEAGVTSRSEYDLMTDRVKVAEAAVRTAQVALRTAQAQLEAQKIGVEEAKARVNQQRVSVRDARIGVERARQSVNSSEARANQQSALLRGSSNLRAKSTQFSPLTGVIADIPARVGQFAVANFTSTPLMTIADMSTINIEVNVDETEIDEVAVGQPVKVKVDAMGEKEIEGVVKLKNPLALSKSGAAAGGGLGNNINVQEAKEFKVVIELLKEKMADDVRNNLKPGMTATASITTKVKQNVLAVPLQAIIEKQPETAASPGASPTPTPAQSAEKPKDIKGIYILDGGKVKFVEVTTGITGESDIEIVSGIQPNVEVVTGPSRVLRTLKEGDKVKKQAKNAGGDAKPEEGK